LIKEFWTISSNLLKKNTEKMYQLTRKPSKNLKEKSKKEKELSLQLTKSESKSKI